MKVACATSFMSGYFRRAFPQLEIIGNGKVPGDLGLLILTGGEDVNPSRYRNRPDGAYGWNDERDEIEFSILQTVLAETDARVLAVCRGLQLTNVFLGGTLIQDLDSRGRGHSPIHDIRHSFKDCILSELKRVNSLHHQSVGELGVGYELVGRVLAIEPRTEIVELICWGDRILGTQFHPELFTDGTYDSTFDEIKEWLSGKKNLFKTPDFGAYKRYEKSEFRRVDQRVAEINLDDFPRPDSFTTFTTTSTTTDGTFWSPLEREPVRDANQVDPTLIWHEDTGEILPETPDDFPEDDELDFENDTTDDIP